MCGHGRGRGCERGRGHGHSAMPKKTSARLRQKKSSFVNISKVAKDEDNKARIRI
jgi:hypothetical protein